MTLPTIRFYFDFASPYAYLAFHQLPKALEGLAYRVQYCPMSLGAIFKARQTTSPVFMPEKRAWINRHCAWLAEQAGLPFVMPAVHPFASVPWLRMALAASPHGQPSRAVVEQLFAAIWQAGNNPDDADWRHSIWQSVAQNLPEVRSVDDAAVKTELFALSDQALAHGVFGAPSCVLLHDDGSSQLFWGMEGLPMLRDALEKQQ